MYQALYRKYRPQTFDDVVGQTAVTTTLKNQLITGKLSHAYLFTGSRGTGKTTCAKILAKAVNCENPVDGNPCNCCASCRGIDAGNILDVQEIDAASNNGVDNVRAIRDDAVYPPAEVKKRVYIIDEVHMLSMSAFNALLKTIEEPPDHLMFILATTELNKVPATILSRCQRFAFRRPTAEDITGRINYVAYQEGIDITAEAAQLLGRLADGAFRDGLSLLDQCASASVGTLDVDDVYQTLGLAGQKRTSDMMEAIAAGDTPAALGLFSELYSQGKDASAMTINLLLNSEGKKMGKTQKGAVWLDPNKTSPFEFYQYWRNVADADVLKCIRMLTFLPLEEIDKMDSWEGSQLNTAKEILAFELTKLVHGEEEAVKAQESARALFSQGVAADMPSVTLSADDFKDGAIDIVSVLVKSGLVSSRNEGRRAVEQGGVAVDGDKIPDISVTIPEEKFDGDGIVVRRGKKNFRKVSK